MHDRIRIQTQRTESIFPVGSTWQGTIQGYRTGLPAGEYDLATNLLNQSQDDAILGEQVQTVTVDSSGGFRSTQIDVAIPKVEGAYAIEFSLRRKRLLQSFVASKNVLTRRIDLIAFDSALKPTRIKEWVGVAKIEPLETRWWSPLNWLTTLSAMQPMVQLPTFTEHTKRPVSYGPQSQAAIAEQPCLVLSANSWQAYPLHIEHAGNPHRVRVRVPEIVHSS